MGNIFYETGNLLNGIFNLTGTNLFADPARTYGYVIAVILVFSLLGAMGKAVYRTVKAN